MRLSKLICTATLLLSSMAFAGDKIDEVLDVGSNGQISIENMRGEVEIVGWDKNQMSVVGELDDRATGYTFGTEDGFTVFKVKVPKNTSRRNWHKGQGSDLKIHLPKGSNVRFESVNGNVEVINVTGGSDIHTVNGNIVAKGLQKRIKLETVNGNVKATELDGKIKLATVNGNLIDKGSKGKVSYNSVNGNIEGESSAARVHVENVNGEIYLNMQSVDELDVSTVNGSVRTQLKLGDDASVSIATVSGSARLVIDGNASARFRLSSHAGGRIKNNLSDDKVKKQKYGPGQSLKFQLGSGDASVEMTSVSGKLTIERK